MSWLEITLDVNLNEKSALTCLKLQKWIEEKHNREEMLPLQQSLFEYLILLRQAFDALTKEGQQNPKKMAAAMILLEIRLQDSLINPELFNTQEDMDYATAVISDISGKGNLLISQLLPTEQDDVREMILNARRYADYSYYLNNFQTVQKFKEAAAVVEQFEWRNSIFGMLALWGGFVLLILVLSSIPIYLIIQQDNFKAYLGFGFLTIISIVLFIVITRFQKAKSFNTAVETIVESGDFVDLERYEKIEEEVQSNRSRALGFQKSAQTLVEKFFNAQAQSIKSTFDALKSDIILPTEETVKITSLDDIPEEAQLTHSVRSIEEHSPKPQNAIAIAQFCGNCGTKIPEGALFCPNCGHHVQLK